MIVSFHIDECDIDGDVINKGIFITFDDNFTIRLKDVDDLESTIGGLKSCLKEIKENYSFERL